jgi:uncharacterized protein YidB (DUF937 family)
MIALLGLLAVAGYQNRDKLGEMLGRITGRGENGNPVPVANDSPRSGEGGGTGGLLGGLGDLVAGISEGGIAGALGDLVDRFAQNGHGDETKTWVQTGPNRRVDAAGLEEALGEDTIDSLIKQTGLSRAELLSRLSAVLPSAIDKLTPEGRLPTEQEASHWAA